MNSNQNLKVLELRNYLLKPEMREKFIDYFENYFIDSQNILGGYVLGQFKIQDENDKFFWMRGFEDMQTRLDFLRGFYARESSLIIYPTDKSLTGNTPEINL